MSSTRNADHPTGSPPPRRAVPIGSIVLIIAGALVCLMALAPLIGGGVLTWAYGTQRDTDGFFTTQKERFETTTYAITSERIDLGSTPNGSVPTSLGDSGTVRLRAQSTGGRPVFLGIASQDDVDRYLARVAHAELEDVRFAPFSANYRYTDGSSAPTPPGESTIWVASTQGPGDQSLEWEPTSGRWSVVVMNSDATPGVSVNATAGAKAPWLLPLAIGLLAGGVLGVLIGAALLVIGVVSLARGTQIDLRGPEPHPNQPIRLEGRLDEPLSRWLWLVKWVLLIPHLIVLTVLWLAFSVVTVVAFFAILFTERYPRSLFEFNVGVLRWTWRVTYYGYSALGTDSYPPFSLGHEPDYPATFEVAYPERLSRGLVLIKWWLLAIPHYLVLGLIGGGLGTSLGWRGAAAVPFGGLIGMLVVFAAIALLFTGQYPRGIYNFALGLNRWVYRVITYVALMRDEYPPFQLDQGPNEPTPRPEGSTTPHAKAEPATEPAEEPAAEPIETNPRV